MKIDRLYDIKESELLSGKDIIKIDLLIQAVTDWPNYVETVNDFFNNIKWFLKIDILTYEKINSGVLKLDIIKYSWEAEALSSLLEIAEFNKTSSLEKIFNELLKE